MMCKARWLMCMVCSVLALSASAAQNDYPSRPIRIIVPQSPGGATNFVGRLVGLALSERVGQSVVVDNRPGAATMIGADLVAKAVPDGYTLLVEPSSLAILPSMYKKMPFDSVKDFTAITILTTYPNVLIVNNTIAARTLKELIALAKAKPEGLSYCSGGTGVGTHLGGELFNAMAGVKLLHVPYKGGGPAVNALLANEVTMHFAPMSSGVPLIKANRVRALGVSSAQRSTTLPDVPTIAEAGVPGYEQTTWNVLLAPSRTPPAVVRTLYNEVSALLKSPSVKDRLEGGGLDPGGMTPQDSAAMIKKEIAKWGKLIRDADIKPGEE